MQQRTNATVSERNSAVPDTLDVTGYRTELFLRSDASAALLKIINPKQAHTPTLSHTNTGNTDTNEKRNESMCKLKLLAQPGCLLQLISVVS